MVAPSAASDKVENLLLGSGLRDVHSAARSPRKDKLVMGGLTSILGSVQA